MDDQLTAEDFEYLRMLEKGMLATESAAREANVGKLMRLGLIATDAVAGRHISGRGKHLLFQRRCIQLLRSVQAGKGQIFDTDVAAWLQKNGFVAVTETSAQAKLHSYEITQRGAAWLTELSR